MAAQLLGVGQEPVDELYMSMLIQYPEIDWHTFTSLSEKSGWLGRWS